MTETTILFADNDTDFLQTWREFLEKEGYQVIPASSPSEARSVMEQQPVALAVIDIRLINDSDTKDMSGLNLAKSIAPT